MLQQDQPDDYVVATGETHSVREFLDIAFGTSASTGRSTSAATSATSAPPRSTSCWATPPRPRRCWAGPEVEFNELVEMMVEHDLSQA